MNKLVMCQERNQNPSKGTLVSDLTSKGQPCPTSSGCCQVSSRSTTIAVPYTLSIWVFPWKSTRKTLRIIKWHSGRSRGHLTVFTEWVLLQTNESCLCKSISSFTMGLYGSLYDYVIHIALIATSRALLILNIHTCTLSTHLIRDCVILWCDSLSTRSHI